MIAGRLGAVVRLVLLASLLALLPLVGRSGNGAAATGTWWLVDTHEHSAFSADARADLGVDAARAKSAGYNAVFLTDHDRLSSFQIEGANANYLSYSDALTGRWNPTTAGSPASSANGVVSSPVHTGTSSLRLSLTAGSATGRTFVYAKRGPSLRAGDPIIDFWVYPQQLSSGAGADVSVSLGGDTTAGSAYGYTTADGVTHLGKTTVLVWQLGTARAAQSGGTNDVIVNQLSHTTGTWNHYVIDVATGSVTWTVGGTSHTSSTTGLAGLPAADRPADYAVLALVKMEAVAAPAATATAYFDDFVIRSTTPRCPAAEFVYRNSLVDSGAFNTSTFTIFPAREMGQGMHSQQFNFDIRNASDYYAAINDSNVAGGYGNDAAFCAATNSASAPWRSTDHGADNIPAVQASGYPTQSNHPGVTDTVANVIATQGHGADLLEVKSGPEYTSTWDAILQQNHVMPGTFGSDAHEGVSSGSQANFVYAPAPSLDDLLHALYDGRTFMAPNTFAGRILFNLDGGTEPYPARYPVYVPATQTTASVRLQITGGLSSGQTVKWYWSSGAAPATSTDTVSGSTYTQTKSIPLGNPFTYVRAAVYNGTTLIASTQPIFFEDVSALPADKSVRVEAVTPASGCRCSSALIKGITSAVWNASTLTLAVADPVGGATRILVGSSGAPTAVTIDGAAAAPAGSQAAFDAATGNAWFYDTGAGVLHVQDRQATGSSSVAATFGGSPPPPPPPTGSGIALVQQKVATLASGSTLTLSPSAATRAGDALLAAIAVRAGGSVTVTSVADSAGAAWTKGAVGYLSGVNSRVELWYRTGAPAVTSLTVTLSASNAAAVLFTEWSGVASASALDRAAGASTASSTTAATPSLATTNAYDLVVGAVNYPAAVGSTLGAGAFAGLSDFSLSTTVHGRAAYTVTSTAGSYRASWSLSGASGGSGGAVLALKASSTTPPPPPSGDTTPPTTTIACNGGACSGTYTAPVSVTLNARDDASGSGVAATYYTADGTDPLTSPTRTSYAGAFTVAASATVRFCSTDRAGNTEQVRSQAITISTGGTVGTTTFVPVADAYVSSDATTTNYGTLTAIRVDGSPTVRTYLRFAVSGLGGTVSRATLRLYANSAQTTGFDAYAVGSTTWAETSLTYATAPALGTKLGSSGAVAAGTWKQVDVTAAVAGNGTFAFALGTTGTTALSLGSRESANAPQLVVETSGSSPPPTTSLQVGAYWYGWYGANGRHWQDGYVRSKLATPQAPLLGTYDSRAAATISTQLGWMHQYGIDFILSSWWGINSYEDVTTHDFLLSSPALGATKVGVLYESLSLLPVTNGVIDFSQAGVETKLVSDIDYLARNYFTSPGYLRVNGRPVVEFYVTRVWRGDYAHAIATLRSTIKQRYGYDLYLIGDEVDWDGTPVADRIKLFDAITAYTMYSDRQTPGWPDATGYLAGVRARYTQFKAVADQYGVHFIPDALPQFNDRGVRLQVDHYVLPAEVRAGLDGSYSLLAQFLDLDAGFLDPQSPTVVVTSWNEWHEDTEIEPTAAAASSSDPVLYTQGYTYVSHGTKLLEAIAAFRAAHGG